MNKKITWKKNTVYVNGKYCGEIGCIDNYLWYANVYSPNSLSPFYHIRPTYIENGNEWLYTKDMIKQVVEKYIKDNL